MRRVRTKKMGTITKVVIRIFFVAGGRELARLERERERAKRS
jgi:hypothetical protein